MSSNRIPRIALTMGDPAGIGPEVLVRSASDYHVSTRSQCIAIGHPEVLQRAADAAGIPLQIESFASITEVTAGAARLQSRMQLACLNPCDDSAAQAQIGTVSAEAGQAAFDCLRFAGQLALSKEVDAITTAPLNKKALHAAGHLYPGHTEILGEMCDVATFGMMLYLPHSEQISSPHGLGVVHTTLHTSIRSVPDLLSIEAIDGKIRLMNEFMIQLGCTSPRVGVCALNPHAGEQGLFGNEETRLIGPAVEKSKADGISVDGPIPADALLRQSVAGEYDGVVAMYHDQGHIALKLIGFDRAVNITLGLPIIRTSPSHGTAFDIAGTGQASGEGMIAATRVAAQLAAARRDAA